MITFGEGRGCLGCQDITQTPEALGGGLPNSSWGGGGLKDVLHAGCSSLCMAL